MPTVITKKSTVAAKVPLDTDLQVGELAVNTADKILYSKHSDNQVVKIGFDPAVPGPIGSTTPSTVAATTLMVTGGNIGPMYVEDANTIAQRNGTTAQSRYLYNTVNGANYERFATRWVGNLLEIGPEKAGTGTLREWSLLGSKINIPTQGAQIRWANGGQLFCTFGTIQIGPSSQYVEVWPDAIASRSNTALTVRGFNCVGAGQTAGGVFVTGGNPKSDETNPSLISGASVTVSGGGGASSSSGAANGGAVNVAGGASYGTGTVGQVNLAYTGSAARGGVKCWGPLTLASSLSLALSAKTADYTLTANDGTITADSTSAAITLTLETAVGHTRIHAFKKTAGSNTITIDGNASETIDGATSITLTDRCILQSNGTEWKQIA